MGTGKRFVLRAAGGLLPVGMRTSLLRSLCGDLRNELDTKLTDGFLEALLGALDIAFALDSDYRRNIEGFGAVFAFRTKDSHVGATAIFQDGNMNVEREARSRFDTRLTFKDADGLRRSLLAGDKDILNTMLTNPVDSEGNLSYLYRFGFLAKELTLRLGMA